MLFQGYIICCFKYKGFTATIHVRYFNQMGSKVFLKEYTPFKIVLLNLTFFGIIFFIFSMYVVIK